MRQALLLSLSYRWQKTNQKDKEAPLVRGASKGHTARQGPPMQWVLPGLRLDGDSQVPGVGGALR